MEEIQLTTAQAYLVMVLGIRLTQNAEEANIDNLKGVLSLLEINPDAIGYTKLYKDLLQAIIDKKCIEFVQNFLEEAKDNISFDQEIVSNFEKLKECDDPEYLLLISIEMQLRNYAYYEDGDNYEKNTEKAIEYLLSHNKLYRTVIYKKNGARVNDKIITTRISQLGRDLIQDMKNLSINL